MAVPAQANPPTAPPALCLVFSLSISKVSSIMDFGITVWNHPFLRNTALCELIPCTSLRESGSELLSLQGGGQTPEGPNSHRLGRTMVRIPGPKQAEGSEQKPRARVGSGAGAEPKRMERPERSPWSGAWSGLRGAAMEGPARGAEGSAPSREVRGKSTRAAEETVVLA